MKSALLLRIAERKMEMNAARDDQPGSCRSRVLVLAEVLSASVMLDDGRARSLTCSDAGKHRKRVYNSMDLAEAEQWRRTFWVLVLDWLMSPSLGQPCAIQEEDFDIDRLTEIDDKYWENEQDPEQAFKQPPCKHFPLSYFVCFINLNQILAVALRTIYSINKSELFLGVVGAHWEQHVVVELDSELNEWIDMVPNHCAFFPSTNLSCPWIASTTWNTTGHKFRELV
ncbi:hypothetical protein V8E53_011660 [Lactarius tabidus]